MNQANVVEESSDLNSIEVDKNVYELTNLNLRHSDNNLMWELAFFINTKKQVSTCFSKYETHDIDDRYFDENGVECIDENAANDYQRIFLTRESLLNIANSIQDALNRNPPKYPRKIMNQSLKREIQFAYNERAYRPGGRLYNKAKGNFETFASLR
jgi:hypothetical protein